MNSKIAVTAEMLGLWVSTMLLYHAKHPEVPFSDLLTGVGVDSALAVVVLWVLLILPLDISPGADWPPALGFVIIASSLAYQGGAVATAFNQLVTTKGR